MLPGLAIAEVSESDLAELRQVLDDQRALIAELKNNQSRQQKEISSLRKQLDGGETTSPSRRSAPVSPHRPVDAPSSDPALVSGKSVIVGEDVLSTIPSIKTTPEGMRISVGGHINRAYNISDDGNQTKGYFVDSGNLPTFAYIKGYKDVSDDLTIGGHIELALQSNSANTVSQDNSSPGFAADARFFEFTAESKRYGKLWAGQGLSSAFFLGDLDMVGMLPYNQLSVGGAFGGLKFVDSDSGDLSSNTVALAFLDIEAMNLINRFRYDSPWWNGFQISGNVGQDSYSAAALRYRRELGDYDLTAVSSYQNNPQGGRIDNRLDGGIGVIHNPTGLSLTAAGALQDFKGTGSTLDSDGDGFTVRAGWRKQLNDIGETKFAVDYQRSTGITIDGDTATSVGIFVGQEISDWSTEVYAGYRFYDLDRPDIMLNHIHGFTFGVRIYFDATFEANRSLQP